MKLKKVLPTRFYKIVNCSYNRFFNSFRNNSYSQEGEDLILQRIFESKNSGFYVDVGAHHPKRFSNTYLFYKKGWHGINIEPNPEMINFFNKKRPRDINIEAAISNTEKTLIYYMFSEPALNTLSFEKRNIIVDHNKSQLINKIEIHSKKLKDILDKNLTPATSIDFLSVDTEGFDLQVLKSNDWERYKPHLILVEDSEFNYSEPNKSEVYEFLVNQGYILIAKTFKTLIFEKAK